MKVRTAILAMALAMSGASPASASEPSPDPDVIYKKIAAIERIMPSERSIAQVIWLGRAYHSTGRPEQAYQQAQIAVAMEPDDGDALLLLGDTLFQKDRLAEALAAFNRLAQLRPGSSIAQLKRSQALSAMGLPREAEAAHGRYQTLSGQATP